MDMKKIIFLVLLLSISGFGQEVFDIKKASKKYDVRLEVKCEEDSCAGDATFKVFRKGEKKYFQTFKTYTEFNVIEARMPYSKRMYDYQSVVFFEDYNFDGIEDLSIRDGNNSGYGGPSYQVYLYSPASKRFVHNQAFTDLNQNGYLGAMAVDKKKKVLRVFSKSGCCLHSTEEYKVVNGNRLKKVYEMEENAMIADENKVQITTSRLVNGKWQTKVTYRKREQ